LGICYNAEVTDARGVPSDRDGAVLATGRGDVTTAAVSMSARAADGNDAGYLEWHVLDHLPEQHRLAGLRHGQRWVSTPGCRAARAAAEPPFDRVDHVVMYLFAEPVDPALDAWFDLGRALREGGRMPVVLPGVELAAYELVGSVAAERVLVGADVVPWRWATGAYLVVEQTADDGGGELDDLVDVPGVAGVWRLAGTDTRRPDRFTPRAGSVLTVCYLDDDPVTVAGALHHRLRSRWDAGRARPLLAAPFHVVAPPDWSRHLPG
jgi:hypothetical protein